MKILVLRNELERQKKALGQEVALLHKQKSALLERGKGRNLSLFYEQNESCWFLFYFHCLAVMAACVFSLSEICNQV